MSISTHTSTHTHTVSTTKYTLLTFIPKNILEQFMRIANFYFFIVSCLQLFTPWSPTGRFGTAFPLICVMLFQAAKDAYEDIKRFIADQQVNLSTSLVLRPGAQWVATKWQDIRVGDVVKIERDRFFPADIVALASSEPQGMLYIETSQLDGETNLKLRKSLAETHHLTDTAQLQHTQMTITCEQPNADLHNFDGHICIAGSSSSGGNSGSSSGSSSGGGGGGGGGNDEGRLSPITNENVLYRGACLKNTKWVYGVVVFTGKQSKLMKNLRNPPHKRSKVEHLTNYYIFTLFAIQWVFTLTCAISITVWNALNADQHWYAFRGPGSHPVSVFFTGVVSYFILFNNFIPISLYVSMEFVKLLQARMLIDQDMEMYHEESDTPANAKTSSLNEELGQVEYIFSDKTGTLTQNLMDFMKFTVDGVEYGRGTTEIGRAAAMREGRELVDDRPADFRPIKGFQFYDERILDGKWQEEPNVNNLYRFFLLLSVCHTAIPEDDPDSPHGIRYQAASPDEGALVEAARQLGFSFCAKDHKGVIVRILDKEHRFEVLNVLEFNSTRKRMSVIVRTPEGSIVLMCKGADSVMFPLLSKSSEHVEQTNAALEKFANEGLRTLVCAQTVIGEEEYHEWNTKFFEPANIALEDKKKKLADAAEMIERNLQLVGTTAIEDKLQDGVPDTIATLGNAGIKIWVLTGDKQETAINIGFACAMLDKEMVTMILNKRTRFGIREQIMEFYEEATSKVHGDKKLAVVIDGESLELLLQTKKRQEIEEHKQARKDPEELAKFAERMQTLYGSDWELELRMEGDAADEEKLEITFLRLCMLCRSVICCRVTPKQKSEVVKLVKDNLKGVITLAIGDGANDVSMIQAAHIGIGISGQEGLQAARAADYSFAQFRFLKRLLLVHGRWNYRRISKLILYSFYKNAIVQLTNFWFVFFNSFSGLSLYENTYFALYNVIFTSVPIMVLAVLDKDVSASRSEEFPELYTLGQRDYYFNIRVFVIWITTAIFHSLVIFFVPYLALGDTPLASGLMLDHGHFGLLLWTSVIILVNLKVLIEMRSWNLVAHIAVWASILVWPVFMFPYSFLHLLVEYVPFFGTAWPVVGGIITSVLISIKETIWNVYMLPVEAISNPVFWFVILLVVGMCLVREMSAKALARIFARQLYHAIQDADSRSVKPTREEIVARYPAHKLLPPKRYIKSTKLPFARASGPASAQPSQKSRNNKHLDVEMQNRAHSPTVSPSE